MTVEGGGGEEERKKKGGVSGVVGARGQMQAKGNSCRLRVFLCGNVCHLACVLQMAHDGTCSAVCVVAHTSVVMRPCTYVSLDLLACV